MWQLEQVTQLEQEEEVLLQGLRVMTRGRDWCRQQLQRVRERQRLGQNRASAVSHRPDPPPQHRVLGQWPSLSTQGVGNTLPPTMLTHQQQPWILALGSNFQKLKCHSWGHPQGTVAEPGLALPSNLSPPRFLSRTLGLRGALPHWGDCCPRYKRWPGAWGSCWLRPVPAG